jgi:hypothetical protein
MTLEELAKMNNYKISVQFEGKHNWVAYLLDGEYALEAAEGMNPSLAVVKLARALSNRTISPPQSRETRLVLPEITADFTHPYDNKFFMETEHAKKQG